MLTEQIKYTLQKVVKMIIGLPGDHNAILIISETVATLLIGPSGGCYGGDKKPLIVGVVADP
jgi:hypothetical protein